MAVFCHLCGNDISNEIPHRCNLADVPRVTNDQLRFIWGWLNACPGERPIAAAIEQALTAARRELP